VGTLFLPKEKPASFDSTPKPAADGERERGGRRKAKAWKNEKVKTGKKGGKLYS